VGRFKVGNEEVCAIDPRFAEPPVAGGEVFLFVDRTRNGPFFNVTAEDVVPVDARGALRMPAKFSATEHDVTRDELLDRIVNVGRAERGRR
jgi:hypothetical protein